LTLLHLTAQSISDLRLKIINIIVIKLINWQRDRETETQRQRDRERKREKERDRERQRETERQRKTERDRHFFQVRNRLCWAQLKSFTSLNLASKIVLEDRLG
jgi:hypothetical protein